jgi:hypothetical protein
MNASPQIKAELRNPTATASRFAENMATLLDLERRARNAQSIAELGFVMVNDSFRLFEFRQALLLGSLRRGRRHFAVSGLAEANEDAAFAVWAKALLSHLDALLDRACRTITAADVPERLAAEWGDWLPTHLVLIPLTNRGLDLGMLAFGRDAAASDPELRLLGVLSDAYAHAWEASLHGRRIVLKDLRSSWRRIAAVFAVLVVGALGFVQVPLTVLAQAQVVSRDSAIMRSPIDAVIEDVVVHPNEAVIAGQPLVRFDGRRISSQLEAARLAVVAAETELQQTRQLALSDPAARLRVPVLQGQLDLRRSEVGFLEQQQERLTVVSPAAGIAIFQNRSELIGRPITIGERLLEVADPTQVRVEIWLAVADAIALEPHAPIRLFLNVDPGAAINGTVEFMSYIPTPGPEGLASYRILADLTGSHPMLRSGLQGTARIYGERVSLAYYVFRRPLAAARISLGL